MKALLGGLLIASLVDVEVYVFATNTLVNHRGRNDD